MNQPTRYTNWQPLGTGGTALVYRAEDQRLGGRPVAIKLLRERFAKDRTILKTLEQEVLTSRRLRHPNIAPVHDFYDGPEGVGVVMDLLEGQELADWEKTHRGRLIDTAPQRLQVLINIFEGLAIAHQGIIHRDLKPGNIMLLQGDPGRPVIMDFGFAMPLEEDGQSTVVGTPKYMAPEQFLDPAHMDQRGDLFAMGIIAYELFTDRLPPTSLAQITRTRQPPRVPLTEIPKPSEFCALVPPALDRLILQLMAFEPENRPSSAEAVLAELRQIQLLPLDLRRQGEHSLRPQRDVVAVPGGRGTLGSSWESGIANEKPRRSLQMSPFSMDRTPVTNAAYRRFLTATGYHPPPLIQDPLFGRDDHPVVGVTWDDAQAYAAWAGGTLPSEAQWEYAARAAGRGQYPWGDEEPDPSHANIDHVQSATSPVGSYPRGRNALGLEDLCGNVWEWCLDVWQEDRYSRIANGATDPCLLSVEDDTGSRVLRGGAYDSFGEQGRCAARFSRPRDTQGRNIGFRLVYPEAANSEE